MEESKGENKKKEIKDLKAKAKALDPIVNIGKEGLSYPLVDELKFLLKKKKLIKVKMLRSYFEDKDKKELAKEIAQKTNSTLVDAIGNVVVLYKR